MHSFIHIAQIIAFYLHAKASRYQKFSVCAMTFSDVVYINTMLAIFELIILIVISRITTSFNFICFFVSSRN